MSPRLHTLLVYIGAIGVVGALLALLAVSPPFQTTVPPSEIAQTANVAALEPAGIPGTPTASTSPEEATREPILPASEPLTEERIEPSPPPSIAAEGTGGTIVRVENPYPFAPESFMAINERTRAALVNILCTAGSGSLNPTSGSGIIIDPRGVILTNAHVAQYVLLAQSERVNLSCTIRSGAPARALWNAEVLYIPPIWIKEHAPEITTSRPTGTGEHDYALLRITGPASPEVQTKNDFPFLPVDTRNGIGFLSDLVLAASYPAEFIGSLVAQHDLYPVSSITPIQELLTFIDGSVDIFSLRGVLEAQSGSSGGPVVNAWGHVIGIITTTSAGETTAERDLHALTLSYIDRDIAAQAGHGLSPILGSDVAALAAQFNQQQASALVQLLIDQIAKKH